jgi:hypothetical protein
MALMLGWEPKRVTDKLRSKKMKAFVKGVLHGDMRPPVTCQYTDALGRPNRINVVPIESFFVLIYFESFNGKGFSKDVAQSLIAAISSAKEPMIVEAFSQLSNKISSYMHPRVGEKPVLSTKKEEALVQRQLANTLGGKTEVATKFGRCDIVTDTMCIEVKHYKYWKSAIGQAVAYGIAEGKSPAIAIFGQGDIGDSFKKDVEDVCKTCGVEVMWLSDRLSYVVRQARSETVTEESKTLEKRILDYLEDGTPRSKAEILYALGGAKATVYRTIDKLVSRKIISQRPSKTDRRALVVQLKNCVSTEERQQVVHHIERLCPITPSQSMQYPGIA